MALSSTGKKVPSWQFFRMSWDGCALLSRPSRIPQRNWIITFFLVPMNVKKDLKAKVESAYSFMLEYSKITVWQGCAKQSWCIICCSSIAWHQMGFDASRLIDFCRTACLVVLHWVHSGSGIQNQNSEFVGQRFNACSHWISKDIHHLYQNFPT